MREETGCTGGMKDGEKFQVREVCLPCSWREMQDAAGCDEDACGRF